jgi:hypothetical protein
MAAALLEHQQDNGFAKGPELPASDAPISPPAATSSATETAPKPGTSIDPTPPANPQLDQPATGGSAPGGFGGLGINKNSSDTQHLDAFLRGSIGW